MQFPQAVTCGQAGIRRTSSRKHSVRREIGPACPNKCMRPPPSVKVNVKVGSSVPRLTQWHAVFSGFPVSRPTAVPCIPLVYADSVDFGQVCQGAQGRPDVQHGGELDEAEKPPCGGWLLGGWINPARSLLWPPSCARRCRAVPGR